MWVRKKQNAGGTACVSTGKTGTPKMSTMDVGSVSDNRESKLDRLIDLLEGFTRQGDE